MKEFLKQIGIENEGYLSDDDEYIIEIDESNEYSKIFSKLDNSDLIHEIDDDSVFDLNNNTLYFESEYYDIELNADLENDEYSLKIRKKVE